MKGLCFLGFSCVKYKNIVASLIILSSGSASAEFDGPDKENGSNVAMLHAGQPSHKRASVAQPSAEQPSPKVRRTKPVPKFSAEKAGDIVPGLPKKAEFTTPVRPEKSSRRALSDISNLTPVSKSKKELSPVRRKMLKKGYTPEGARQSVPKSVMEKIFDAHLPPYPEENYKSEKVFLNMSLFEFDQTFLARQGGQLVWETNRERMLRGAAPICYRGYVDPKRREGMSTREIFQLQSGWNIEMHHLTLDMQGYGILMVVRGLHLGGDAAYLVDFDGEEIKISQSGITKQDRENLDVGEGSKLVANVLHPANGSSKINRDSFRSWRTSFWKALANGEIKVPAPKPAVVDSPFSAAHQRALLMAPQKVEKTTSRYRTFMSTRHGIGRSSIFK